ncbi:unnamed protein product [marine sediment metagenome]|uniref:Uncharacterized protein n=1 Tax=marine sediment metagenome TaxID=412755 RepID=X1SIG7_9ZZZZ
MSRAKDLRKKQQKKRPGHTPLAKHRRYGSTLLSPMSEAKVETIHWDRDLLPEHLWIAGLADVYSIDTAHQKFSEFLDIVDAYIPSGSYAFGYISDFDLVPADRRDEFWSKHESQIQELFHKPIGRILAFYPDNPASWLVSRTLIEREGPLDPTVELNRLRTMIVSLLPGKDDYAGHIRAIPLGRVFKHKLIHMPRDLPVVKLLPKYKANSRI